MSVCKDYPLFNYRLVKTNTSIGRRKRGVKWFQDLATVHDAFDNGEDDCGPVERIRIAVLDTGFQPPDSLMTNYESEKRIRVEQSDTFLAQVEGDQDTRDWRLDQDGHGTNVALILLKVAPVADLHIARVFRSGKDLRNPQLASTIHQRIAQVPMSQTPLPGPPQNTKLTIPRPLMWQRTRGRST